MPISRRTFIHLGAVTAITAGAALDLSAFASDTSPAGMMDQIARARAREESKLSYSAFAACINSKFTLLTGNSDKVAVKLVGVDDHLGSSKATAALRGVKENFSLAFKVPSQERLAQNTYEFEHEELGKFSLFIGPVQSGKHGYVYEAVINRI